MAEGVRLGADSLRRVTSAILKAGGSEDSEAALVADHLIQANLAGHDSHGVGMIPAYVRHSEAGLVVPNTRAKIVKDDGAMLMFDGARLWPSGRGRGHGRRHRALPTDRRRGDDARQRPSHRPGRRVRRAGDCLRSRLAALRQRDRPSRPRRTVPGNRCALFDEPRLHRAARHGSAGAVLLDMATSSVAMGKIRVAKNEGKPAPEGVLIDQSGRRPAIPT